MEWSSLGASKQPTKETSPSPLVGDLTDGNTQTNYSICDQWLLIIMIWFACDDIKPHTDQLQCQARSESLHCKTRKSRSKANACTETATGDRSVHKRVIKRHLTTKKLYSVALREEGGGGCQSISMTRAI